MPKRKPVQKYDTVYYKYSAQNVAAHKVNPEWYPKVNSEGMCLERVADNVLRVKWNGIDEPRLIEEDRVGVRRKNARYLYVPI
jgi:hypothetical protein